MGNGCKTQRSVRIFCLLLLVLCTSILSGCGGDSSGGLLRLDSPDTGEYIVVRVLADDSPGRADSGGREPEACYINGLEGMSFKSGEVAKPLENYPGQSIVCRDGKVFHKKDGAERLLLEVEPVIFDDWPEYYLEFGDIDFDGKPDFFVMTTPAVGSGSSIYTLIGWDRIADDGKALFTPFPAESLPPSPDDYEARLFFKDGRAPNPYFDREKRMLEFHSKNWPYHDTERWCHDGGHYYLCERIKQSYYAHANNMFELARHEKFGKDGRLEGVFCTGLPQESETERFFATESVPLLARPDASAERLGTIEPGQIAIVLDYRLGEAYDEPVIWFKVKSAGNPELTGWCLVNVRVPTLAGDHVSTGGWRKLKMEATRVRRTDNGPELSSQEPEGYMILPVMPTISPYTGWQ